MCYNLKVNKAHQKKNPMCSSAANLFIKSTVCWLLQADSSLSTDRLRPVFVRCFEKGTLADFRGKSAIYCAKSAEKLAVRCQWYEFEKQRNLNTYHFPSNTRVTIQGFYPLQSYVAHLPRSLLDKEDCFSLEMDSYRLIEDIVAIVKFFSY